MGNVALTVSGSRYEVKLEEDFAVFVNNNLQDAGIKMNRDNNPDKLLQAYLRLAKRAYEEEEKLEALLTLMDKRE